MEIIYNTDNGKYGIEEIKAIITEQGYLSKLAFIKMKWMIGEKIATDEKLIKHKKEVAEEINYPVSEISRCVRGYKKSCELYKANEGEEIEEQIEKNQSGHKIVNNLLPPPDESEEINEKDRLEEMRNESRMRKVFKTLKKDIKENNLTLTQDLLDFLKLKYKIDEEKNYD